MLHSRSLSYSLALRSRILAPCTKPLLQGLPWPTNADSKGFPYSWPPSCEGVMDSSLIGVHTAHIIIFRTLERWSSGSQSAHNANGIGQTSSNSKIQSEMKSVGPRANCSHPYSSAGACQGLPGMMQERVTMADPIPLQLAMK